MQSVCMSTFETNVAEMLKYPLMLSHLQGGFQFIQRFGELSKLILLLHTVTINCKTCTLTWK
jgi:hypothetical protein